MIYELHFLYNILDFRNILDVYLSLDGLKVTLLIYFRFIIPIRSLRTLSCFPNNLCIFIRFTSLFMNHIPFIDLWLYINLFNCSLVF